MADNRSFIRLLWPEIDDLTSARDASNLGALGCLIIALYLGGTLFYRVSQYGPDANPDGWLGYTDAAIFLLCAIGVWLRWRAVAIIALLLFIAIVVMSIAAVGVRGIGMLGVAVAAFLISGVRGTLAAKKFVLQEKAQSGSDA